MKIATRISRVDNDALELEYLEMMRTHPKTFSVYVCASCLTKTMNVKQSKMSSKQILENIEKSEQYDFDRKCPNCGDFMIEPWVIDYSGVNALEKGVGVN